MLAFATTFCALIAILKTNFASFVLDKPNHRSLHATLTPRTGGLAIMLGVLASFALLGGLWAWISFVLALMLISLIDDISGLPVRWRLALQVLLCTGFVWILMLGQPWWLKLLALPALIWMTNLYNFMDGADGLAGGMAVFGFGAYAIAAYLGQNQPLAIMCGAIAASSLAFLMFNFHPAKIFMGDAGSIPLGFLSGAIGLYGWQRGLWLFWFPIMVFSPFIVDATVTLFKRGLRGEKVWQAHREHYYQRLVLIGWGHKKTALAEYILMLAIAICALVMLKLPNLGVFLLLLFWLFIYSFIMLTIDKKWHKRLP